MTTNWRPEHGQETTLRAVLGLAALLATAPCAAGDDWAVRPYYYFVHWVSMGRTELALEQFADDAVVVAGPGCTQSAPCIGRAAIREGYLAALIAGRTALPLSDQRLDGHSLHTHGETILHDEPGGGTAQLRGGHVFEFRDGRISSLRVELDTGDAATAAFVKRREAEAVLPSR